MASFSKRLRRVEKASSQRMDDLLAADDELRRKVRQEVEQTKEELRNLADEFDHLLHGEAQ
jgi:hypothetical protein